MTIQLRKRTSLFYEMPVEEAIIQTLAYSDVFDYPLRIEELHRYLPVKVSLEELRLALSRGVECVSSHDGFYFLEGREALTALRRRREAISRPALWRALQFGRVLGSLPFIRMVALTGSLAVLNSDWSGDLDYMLVTANGRVWTARGFAVLFGHLTARFGYALCPNLIVAESALKWTDEDIYSAREICQMIPITGKDVYERLRRTNDWTDCFLPNASGMSDIGNLQAVGASAVQSLMEMLLRGSLGNRLEEWEMKRKIRRLTRQEGFGVETRFSDEICQGNFLHHGAQTRRALEQRLTRLHVETSAAKPYAVSD